jgi:hypothetical protein
MATNISIIEDERLAPYFIKLVNSSYEVHQKHTPKDADKKEYTKFICSKDTIESAVGAIAKRKLAQKRRTKRTILLSEYLQDLKKMNSVMEELIGEDSVEKRIRSLAKRVAQLEALLGAQPKVDAKQPVVLDGASPTFGLKF